MCGVRKLTHTAYANQRMTLCLKIGKIESKGGIRWSRYVSNHVACFHHTCFYLGVCRCLRQDVVIGNTPLFFSAQGSVVSTARKRKPRVTVSQVPDTSTTLLRDVADSSHARWSVFYSRYQPMMRTYLQVRFPSLDADDIIQETFVALAKILPDYKYESEKNGAFRNFLTGVLRNKALCALDKSRRNMAIEERMQLAINVNGKSVHEQSYRDWREKLFEVALQQLLADESIHDRTKQAFIRTAIKGESIESVAKSLGVQRNTIDCMRSRTLQQLREIVERLKDLC